LLWHTQPDDQLLAAAAAEQLGTREQVAAQARRMLADPRGHGALIEFHQRWMGLDGLDGLAKDDKLYPQFTEALAAAMKAETGAFVDDVLSRGDGRLETLLTAPYTFGDAALARVYGVAPPAGAGRARLDLDPTQRAGLLTQPGFLSVFANPNQTSPVQRGKFVRQRFLCETIPDPPPNLVVTPPDPSPDLSTRQRYQQHSAAASCSGCHAMMDPIGFAFESFDAIGAWRSSDAGQPIDTTFTLTQTDVDSPLNGAVQLAHKLAASQQVRDCVVAQWFRFAQGRMELPGDACVLQQLGKTFEAAGHDVRELVVAVTQTDAFITRRPVAAAAGSAP
jgi:hypothetical protein